MKKRKRLSFNNRRFSAALSRYSPRLNRWLEKKKIYNKENISQARKEEKSHEKKNKRSEKKDHQDKKRIEREDIV